MSVRTSGTDSLKIDAMPCGTGHIGMTLCPGKKGDSYYGGRWDRDLGTDLDVVAGWGATTLVSLMESSELSMLHVDELGSAAEQAGLDWHHLPIEDLKAPDERFERPWVYSGHVLRRKLIAGERIVIHCRGGLGRTGTVAARLAIELGAPPETVLCRVRASRPGAVETTAQEAYVLDQGRVRLADAGYADRVLGCLLGGAVGDALGYGVEFASLADIRTRFGLEGIQQPVLGDDGEAEVSDDTQMTLFTAEGLLAVIRAGGTLDPALALERVRAETLNWYAVQTGRVATASARLANYAVLRKRQAPGNTCLGACSQGATGTLEQPINGSKGCGGVMRVAPVGLCLGLNTDEAFELAARCAAQTHGHPSGYFSAGVMAAIVRAVLDGMDMRGAISHALEIARCREGAGETVIAVERAVELAAKSTVDPVSDIARLGEGWVGEEALAIGLYAALTAPRFTDAVRIASNHGGDSDSTASIAGQIWGAWQGLAEVPHGWVRRVDVLDPLLDVAARMIRAHGH